MNSLNMVVDVEEDENIVCPSCGVTAINSDGPREQPSCQHIRFIYLEGYGFDYAAAELGALVQKVDDGDVDTCDESEFWDVMKADLGAEGTILKRTDSGMACGPVSFTVWVGFRGKREI